jgi:Arc/MetJ-type ribon-helix-helix transcriptional regulator
MKTARPVRGCEESHGEILGMVSDHYSTRIDFDLTGELARRLDDIVQRGIVGSKPEAIRQALIEYFNKLDEQQLRSARLRFLEEKGTMPHR